MPRRDRLTKRTARFPNEFAQNGPGRNGSQPCRAPRVDAASGTLPGRHDRLRSRVGMSCPKVYTNLRAAGAEDHSTVELRSEGEAMPVMRGVCDRTTLQAQSTEPLPREWRPAGVTCPACPGVHPTGDRRSDAS